jgi:hypothetical protein
MVEEAKSDSRSAPPTGANGKEKKHDESAITGPSLGPHTVINREPVEERLARHDQSEVDALGKDKRRSVVGQSYGPSKLKQLSLYGIFLAAVVGVVVGGFLLLGVLDKPVGKDIPKTAPWAQPHVKQIQPKPIQ